MEKFELELDDEFLISIGRITVNFATLEQIISFFIWNLIEADKVFAGILTDVEKLPSQQRLWVEFMMSTPSGLEKTPSNRLGQTITAQLSFRQKTDLLSSVCRDRLNNPDEVAKLDKLLSRVARLEQERNIVVHSVWTASALSETTARIKTTARRETKGLKINIESVSVEDLEDVADNIGKAAYDVQTLLIRFYNPSFSD